jgi:hypothetical protein
LLEQEAQGLDPLVVTALALGEPMTMGPPVLKFEVEINFSVFSDEQCGQRTVSSCLRTISSKT